MEDNIVAARDCIARAMSTSWWHWYNGSRPFFWRWPEYYWFSARDWRRNYIIKELPCNTKHQSIITAEVKERMKGKLMDVRRKGYFGSKAEVKSLTPFFHFPKTWKEEGGVKVVDEIRMVYDATQSGLNAVV